MKRKRQSPILDHSGKPFAEDVEAPLPSSPRPLDLYDDSEPLPEAVAIVLIVTVPILLLVVWYLVVR